MPSLCSFMTLWTLRFPLELADDDVFFAMCHRPALDLRLPPGPRRRCPEPSAWRTSARGGSSRRIRTATRLGQQGVFGIGGNAVLQKLFLTFEHPLSQSLEIDIQFFRLGQHLRLFFPYMVPDALSKNCKFCIPMIILRVDSVQLGGQNLGDVMFLIRFIHNVPPDMRADGGIEDFFLQEGVNFQLGQGPIDDLCFPSDRLRLFKVFEETFDRVVVLLQDRDGVGFG